VVLDKCKGGYFRMLQRLFPEIGLDESAFNIRGIKVTISKKRKRKKKEKKEKKKKEEKEETRSL
jgi:hypothetical protein